jgi:hypothetical protein
LLGFTDNDKNNGTGLENFEPVLATEFLLLVGSRQKKEIRLTGVRRKKVLVSVSTS